MGTVWWSVHTSDGQAGGTCSLDDAPLVVAAELGALLSNGERSVTVRVGDPCDVVDAAFEQAFDSVARLKEIARDPEHPHQLSALGDLRTIGWECWL